MQRIFLTGLSGSGKSSIGRHMAALLGWDFIDTDDLLAAQSGVPVGQALLQLGEEHFRQLESEILRDAAEAEKVVIATGGGMVISAANRALMRERGLTVYLQVSVETAWQRIQQHLQQSGESVMRPLVVGDDGFERLNVLYETRKDWYEEAEVHVDTEHHAPEVLAQRLVAYVFTSGFLASSTIPREVITQQLLTSTSQAIVEWGGLQHLPLTLRSYELPKRLFIVTDSAVGSLYAQPLLTLLEENGFAPQLMSVPAGEASKSFSCFQQIIDWLVQQKAEQKEAVIALGGGVVGDLAGFVASCYQRGVPLIQVPTTLLAQVDSAIGGKTGINHALGKNLIGAFYQAKLIYADPAFLLTLPERVYREGWAEIIKYAMILDAELFSILEGQVGALLARDAGLLSAIVARCIRMKMDIVQRDERDGGLRNVLNYGHTFGHALEAITEYGTWLHGEAVAIGMEVAARIAVASGLLSQEDARRQRNLLQAFGLPVQCAGVNIDAIIQAMQRDKKVRAGSTRWILTTSIGHADVYSDIDTHIAREAMAAVCGTDLIDEQGADQ
ncbi:MAG TPA: 3-dehydroquinate synthase [Ktedonobacteraceae bacterium]|nr:3-dehydroquinate synthase [Ktedonobacteraceae bacterium]